MTARVGVGVTEVAGVRGKPHIERFGGGAIDRHTTLARDLVDHHGGGGEFRLDQVDRAKALVRHMVVHDRDVDDMAFEVVPQPPDALLIARIEHHQGVRLAKAKLRQRLGVDLDRVLGGEPRERRWRWRIVQDAHLLALRLEPARKAHLTPDGIAVGIDMRGEQEALVSRDECVECGAVGRDDGAHCASSGWCTRRPATSVRNQAWMRESSVSSGWNASATAWPARTPTGSPW